MHLILFLMMDQSTSNFELRASGVFVLRASILVNAPIDRCFLLSTSVAIVQEELGMKPVEGRTAGLVQPGDLIRWEGWQLGLRHYHVSRISSYCRPTYLQDRMVAGRFAYFEHDHHFHATGAATLLQDELRFSMPAGPLGLVVGRLVMVPHIRGLMRRRFLKLKGIAETNRWHEYLDQDAVSAGASS